MKSLTLKSFLFTVCLLSGNTSLNAQDLVVEANYSASQVIGDAAIGEVHQRMRFIEQTYNEATAYYQNVEYQYSQTRDPGAYQELQRVANDMGRMEQDYNELQRVLAPTYVRLIDDSSNQYPNVMALPWDQDVHEFLRNNPQLLGTQVVLRTNVGSGGQAGSGQGNQDTADNRPVVGGYVPFPSATTPFAGGGGSLFGLDDM